MTVKIQLMVNSGSGVLAAVVSQLQQSGIRVKSHNMDSVNGSSALLTLEAGSSGGLDAAQLRSNLTEIDVVQSVQDIVMGGATPANEVPRLDVPEELVDRIVESYPKIMSGIQHYEEQIGKDPQRTEKLRQLGKEVGKKHAERVSVDEVASTADLLDRVVIPAISPIAEASRKDDAVEVLVSLFTRRSTTSMDLIGGEDESCYFLSGFIEGMASSCPGFESVSVEESRCRAHGDSQCVFNLK